MQVHKFEEQRKAELHTKRDEIKYDLPSAINYHYVNSIQARGL